MVTTIRRKSTRSVSRSRSTASRSHASRRPMTRSEAGRKGALARWGKISSRSSTSRNSTHSRSATSRNAAQRRTQAQKRHVQNQWGWGSEGLSNWGYEQPSNYSRNSRQGTRTSRQGISARNQKTTRYGQRYGFSQEYPSYSHSRSGFGTSSRRKASTTSRRSYR